LTGLGSGPGRIVGGVDGSERSKDALRWGARQAELTGATIEAIAASQFPAFYGWTPADLVGPDFARSRSSGPPVTARGHRRRTRQEADRVIHDAGLD
jgi:hypothetical protein